MLAVTGSKGKTSVSDKLHDHSDNVLIRQKPQQLAGKATLPDGRCFLVPWDVSTSVIVLKHDRPKRNLPKEKGIYLPISMFSAGLLIGKRPFQDGVMSGKNCPFQGTLLTSPKDPLFFR